MDEKSQFEKDFVTISKTFLAGGVAGCCAKTVVAPFDRVKILLQAHHQHYHHLGIFATMTKLVETEGSRGLFKGNGAQMIRIFPYAAVQFSSYEAFKKYFEVHYGDHQWCKLASGSLAGLVAVIFTYPLDVIRSRLAFQVAEELYSGIWHAIRVICKHEGGLRGLYKGIVPSMLGMAPYAGLSFYAFENMKTGLLEHFPQYFGRPSPSDPSHVILSVPAKLLCGGAAGAIAQTVSYPLDVARRKMQLGLMLPESHQYSSWSRTLAYVVKTHGVRQGLYRGLTINYIKVTPMVAVSFSVYEMVKQALGLDTAQGSI